jgi:hypothetical protein
LVTAASIALPVAESLSRRVEERTAAVMEPYERDFLSMGTGVVIGRPQVPIRVLRRLAGELESSAKDLCYDRDEEVHAVDFHRITGEGSTTLRHVRSEVLRPERDYVAGPDGEPTCLTARPFTLETLREVQRVASEWEEKNLPRSKMHDLREALFESPAEAMKAWAHVVARSGGEARSAWQDLARLVDPAARGEDLEMPFTTPVSGGPASNGSASSGDASSGAASNGASSGPGEARRTTYLLDVMDVLALD